MTGSTVVVGGDDFTVVEDVGEGATVTGEGHKASTVITRLKTNENQ